MCIAHLKEQFRGELFFINERSETLKCFFVFALVKQFSASGETIFGIGKVRNAFCTP